MKFSFLLGVSILLVSCATNADIGSAMKQLKEDGVNPAQATCSPSSPINDALPIFQTFRGELTGLNADTMPKERTTNCLPAILLILKNPGQIKEIKLINSFAGIYALRKDHGVQACAKGDIGCCGNIDNSYVQCVRDLDINPGTSPVMKKFALLPTMQALMHEVGISSFVVPAADLKTVKFVGDEIYFLWPIAIRTDAAPVNYLFTKVDSELVQRLVVAVNELAPTFRAISNSGYPGASSYICNYDGILPRPYLKLPDNIRLKVGTGQSTNIRRVTGVDYNKSLLINVLKSDSRDISALEVDEGVEPVLGGDNRNLFEFANALTQKGLAPFTCYGKALSDVFNDPTSLRFFNSYSASVFYFGLIYLNGFANEFMVAPAVASVKEEVIDLKEAEKSILLASGEAAKLRSLFYLKT